MRLAPAAFAVALCTFLAPGVAHASYVEAPTVWDRTSAKYTAAPGELNDVTVTLDGERYAITDDGAKISAGEGCEIADPPAAHKATCDSGPHPWARWIELHLGDGNDSLSASFPQDPQSAPTLAVTGEAGADRITGDSYYLSLNGGADDDELTGRGGSGGVGGAEGNDRVTGDLVHGELDGGPGDDTVTTLEQTPPGNPSDLSGWSQAAHGGDGNDRIESHGLKDSLHGDAGDDLVIAGAGNDGVTGGPGNDELHGGDGSDTLYGGEGNDVLDGGGGDGVSRSQTGYAIAGARLFRDVLDGGPGADVLQGGAGDFDAADYSTSTAPVSVTLDGIANDGEAGEGDLVATDVEDATGGGGGDVLSGNGGPNTLRGGAGDDTIDGRGGYQDDAVGGSGNDILLFGDGGEEAEHGVQGALPGFAFDDFVTCNGGDDTAFVDATDVGQAGQVSADEEPCEHVVMTERPQALPVHDGVVTLPVGCGAGPLHLLCNGTATVRLPKRAHRAATTVPRATGRAVARRRFHQRLGRTHRVKVRMNRAGRRAARHHRRLRAWVTYTYRRR